MTIRELIDQLQQFDPESIIRIGMKQTYGSDFAMSINHDISEHMIDTFYGVPYKAVIITEGNQIGVVDYNDELEEEE